MKVDLQFVTQRFHIYRIASIYACAGIVHCYLLEKRYKILNFSVYLSVPFMSTTFSGSAFDTTCSVSIMCTAIVRDYAAIICAVLHDTPTFCWVTWRHFSVIDCVCLMALAANWRLTVINDDYLAIKKTPHGNRLSYSFPAAIVRTYCVFV